jgi:FKBP-type peptidyl-prolyl cis-trans isomerase FkpA
MVRVLTVSVLALAGIYLLAQGLGMTSEQAQDRVLLAELNRQEGDEFLRRNAGRAGVVVLPGGMQVEMLRAGDGDTPGSDDRVEVHYRGWHADGRLFDSTYRLGVPGTVPVERTIPGWQKLLTSVPVGSHVRVVLPPDLAYGAAGSGRIGPQETLIFEIELLGIASPPVVVAHDPLQQPVPGLR